MLWWTDKTLKLLVLTDWRPAGSCMYYSEAKCINNSWRHFWKSSRVVPDSSAVKQHERVGGEGGDLFWYYFFLIPAYVIWGKRVDPQACLRAMCPRALTCKSHDPKATQQGSCIMIVGVDPILERVKQV